jgi:hypothetical protein
MRLAALLSVWKNHDILDGLHWESAWEEGVEG